MNEREELEHAMQQIERQRPALGHAAVEAALAGLRQKLADLESFQDSEPSLPAEGGLESERKLVTTLFADVVDSTALAERMDPEVWMIIMNRAFERILPSIYKYEGTIARLMGDAVLALFGAPVAHEDDAVRAVRAALDLLNASREYAFEVKQQYGIPFAMRVGLNTGHAVTGDVGSDLKSEYTAMGDAINLAARMQSSASPNTIQISEYTYRLVKPFFLFKDRGRIQVKGKAQPVRAYEVLEERKRLAEGRGLEGLQSPLVGRQQDYAALLKRFERVAAGEGGIVGVIGEAGLGKSRLMAEALSNTRLHKSVLFLEGRSHSLGRAISYMPFQDILRQWAGVSDQDSEPLALEKLENRISDIVAEQTQEILPFMASLLSLEVRGNPPDHVRHSDGEAIRLQIFRATRRFFEGLAKVQPTVLIFEDYHWSDESSAHLLEHLLPLVERVPILLCFLTRTEPDTPAARLRQIANREYSDYYTEINLRPLSTVDSTQLIHNLLGVGSMPPQLREAILEKAEGNPFFLEEVLRTLIAAGLIVQDLGLGIWRMTDQVSSIDIPDTIQGVIMARVDRLEEDVKQVLRIASVIGRSFLYRVIRAIVPDNELLDGYLSTLQKMDFIRVKRAEPELEYIFKHALAQETIYESILLAKRIEIHARVGEAIEGLYSGRLEEFAGLLAYHYARAEVWEKAQAYLLKAGDRADSVAADAEAIENYQQAMVAYGKAFGDRWDPVQRAALEHKMGAAYYRRGDYSSAMGCLHSALERLGLPLPTSTRGIRQAMIEEAAQHIRNRLFPSLLPKTEPQPLSSLVEETIRVYETIFWMDAVPDINKERYLLIAMRTLNYAEAKGYPYGKVIGAAELGTVLSLIPVFRLARKYHHRAVRLAEQSQEPASLGKAYISAGLHSLYQGEWQEALANGRRAADACREVGDLHSWGLATFITTTALRSQGKLVEAIVESYDLIRLGQEGADSQVLCWGLRVAGSILRRMGVLEEAARYLKECNELSEAIPDYRSRVHAGAELGQIFLGQGNLMEALSVLEDTALQAARHKVRGISRGSLVTATAKAYLLAAEQAIGSQKEAWLNKSSQACREALRHGKVFPGELPHAMLLKGRYEWLAGRPAAAAKWWRRSLHLAETMGMRMYSGEAHLELGRRLGQRSNLQEALEIFTDIGAERDLAMTKEALLLVP